MTMEHNSSQINLATLIIIKLKATVQKHYSLDFYETVDDVVQNC